MHQHRGKTWFQIGHSRLTVSAGATDPSPIQDNIFPYQDAPWPPLPGGLCITHNFTASGCGRNRVFLPSTRFGGVAPRRDSSVFGLVWRLCRHTKPKTLFLRGRRPHMHQVKPPGGGLGASGPQRISLSCEMLPALLATSRTTKWVFRATALKLMRMGRRPPRP